MSPQMTTAEKLARARTRLRLNQRFFGTLGLRLTLVPGSLPTMATDEGLDSALGFKVGGLKPLDLLDLTI